MFQTHSTELSPGLAYPGGANTTQGVLDCESGQYTRLSGLITSIAGVGVAGIGAILYGVGGSRPVAPVTLAPGIEMSPTGLGFTF